MRHLNNGYTMPALPYKFKLQCIYLIGHIIQVNI